jgi:hypothetical protein
MKIQRFFNRGRAAAHRLSIAVGLLLSACLFTAFPQALTSVSGLVTDASGAIVANVAITLEDKSRGLVRNTVSDETGLYNFAQIPPGKYRLAAKTPGFAEVVIENVELQVNTPATVNLELRQVAGVAETITVSAVATQLNATDASLGNAIGTKEVLQLPMYLRNVVGLLTFQPGVTSFTESSSDDRNGSVNGGRADQANVTLDGIDVNDHHSRRAFTSVVRLSLDAVSEFRTTTSNAGADQGRTSGAEISLVTKSGTNDLHGSIYDFHRNTVTSANSFFNNRAGVQRPALLVDVFGASAGGAIRKNRLFYFLNYEGRRDRSATGVLRTVPSAELREGIVQYKTSAGGIARLTPADLRSVDPAGIGVSAPFLEYMQSYPLPNDFTVGDGLNVAGFRFTAPQKSKYDIYTTRFDYAVDSGGHHNVFARGNLQNERTIGVPQFLGDPPNSVSLDNTKGYAIGWNASWRPDLITTTRFGLTRAGSETTGVQTRNFIIPNGWDSRFATSRGVSRIIPAYHWSQDLTWIRGRHEWRFGGTVRRIRNSSENFSNSFHTVQMWQGWLRGSASEYDAGAPGLDRSFNSAYRTAVGHALGVIPQGIARYNYDLQGNVIPPGMPLSRTFGNEEYDFFAQDTWKVSRSVTIGAGLRYLLAPPVRETNGLEVTTNHRLGEWAGLRYWLGNEGRPQSEVAPIVYIPATDPAGRPLYPYQKKNFAPRFSVAWSPSADSGWLRKLTGGAGRTSIRAGWGMFYDQLGQPLMSYLSGAASFGLSSSISNPAGTLSSVTAPRFTGPFDIPTQLIRPAPQGGLPQEAPRIQATTAGIDDHMRIPYSMNMNFSVGREFNNGLFIQASYVGRLARSTPLERDLALHTNLKDPASGVHYFQAAEQMLDMWRRNVPVAQVGRIPYWENLWPGAAGNGLTATQAIYNVFRTYNVDTSAVTYDIDINCAPSCSRFGPFSMFNEQIASYTAYTSDGRGNYNALQMTVRKRLGNDLRMDLNYTWSKSIDLSSNTPRSPGGINLAQSWDPRDRRAVSDYDVRHSVNAFAIWEMPFGKGKKFLSGAPGVVNAVLGGWQLSGSWFQTSGLVTYASDGNVWPTSWGPAPYATQISVPVQGTSKDAPAVVGAPGPNIFPDPATAFKSFEFTLPGVSGSRNTLRGDGTFLINMGLAKRFFMPYSERHSLQFRWESFNLFNSVRFDPRSASLSLTSVGSFGKYTGVLNSPRQMQFGLRYEF